MPSNWLLFDRIRALTRQHNIYQAERVLQNQSQLDRLTAGAEFLDANNQTAILDQTNLQINRLERYKDYEQMDQMGEISLALDLYADEACLTGDTRIPLLDGSCPTIAELAERGGEHWVYSFDQKKNQYVPALARSARVTGYNVPVVKVTLDDGSTIRCTSDHLFMLSDNSFMEAGDLSPGDSLKPLYKKTRYRSKEGTLFDEKPYPTATGYEYFYNGKHFTSTHRWVYHALDKHNPEVVHHRNYNSLDNTPGNLEGLTILDHDQIHSRSGNDNPSFNDISWEQTLVAVQDWHGPMTRDRLCAVLDIGERVLYRLLTEQNITWQQFKSQYHRCSCCDKRLQGNGWVCNGCRRDYLRDYHQRKKAEAAYKQRRVANKRKHYDAQEAVKLRTCRSCKQMRGVSQFQRNGSSYSPYCKDCRPNACQKRYLDKSFGNHRVAKVEQCGVADKVYDLDVPDHHCFAAGDQSSWIIVHNSLVDPEKKHTLVIRARNRRLKKELESLFFDTLLWDNYCRPAIRYLCKYGDMPFEIIPTIDRTGVASLRFMDVYNFTRIETRYGDLVGFFHQDELYPNPQFMHPWQVMHWRLTSFENIYHPYGRCQAWGTKVSTPDGHKNIEDLQEGEDVYAFDGRRIVPTKVTATCNSGRKQILRISTRRRATECSENHPVLVREWIKHRRDFKDSWFSELSYKRADELQQNDEIAVSNKSAQDPSDMEGQEAIGSSEQDVIFETVLRIEDAGIQETADIQVEHPASNFIADGIVVHNSVLDGGRKAFKQLRLMEDAALIYRICLTGDSRIWTPKGYTPIAELEEGDTVYCQPPGAQPHTTSVVRQVCNGVRDVYKVSTKYRSLRATATHPFLVRDIYDPKSLHYVDLKDLDPERHLIRTPRIADNGVEHHIKLWSDRQYAKLTPSMENQFRSNTYENIVEAMRSLDHPMYLTRQFLYMNKGMPLQYAIQLCGILGLDQELLDVYTPQVRGGSKLPTLVTAEFARFMGFYLGDGYSTSVNWKTGLSLGTDHKTNQAYIELFRKFHNRVKLEYKKEGSINRLNTAVVCDKQLYLTWQELGLSGGAHTKRIPKWVYQLPLRHKIEIIMGFIDADGSEHGGEDYDYYTVEICNRLLLEDLKVLCDQVGWRTGHISTRIREGGMNHMKKLYTSHSLFINPKFRDEYEKIVSIESAGQEAVYDITVDDESHNFIADGMVVHNTRAPEKRKFTIPVGLIPPKEVPEYMQMVARQFKRQRFYNPTTGAFDERYSPLIQEDDFFLPRRPDGVGPDVDTLPGAENLDQIADIEYFKKKMIAPTKIPFARVGIGEGAGEASEKSLSQSHAEFAKAVQWIQREAATGLTKIALVHLALRGYSVDDLKGFSIALTATSAMEELYRIETWQTRAGVMSDLNDLGWFPKEWIVTHFTDLAPDEIEELKEMEQVESEGGPSGGMPGGLDLEGPGPEFDVGEEEGEAGEEGEAELDLEPEEAGEGIGMEGLDTESQRRLLNEIRSQDGRKDVRRLVENWAQKLGKPLAREDVEYNSGYTYMIESKELDGLSRTSPDEEGGNLIVGSLEVHDPNQDGDNLLVEWSVDEATRSEVIKETYEILTDSQDGGLYEDDGDDEITDDDVQLLQEGV